MGGSVNLRSIYDADSFIPASDCDIVCVLANVRTRTIDVRKGNECIKHQSVCGIGILNHWVNHMGGPYISQSQTYECLKASINFAIVC